MFKSTENVILCYCFFNIINILNIVQTFIKYREYSLQNFVKNGRPFIQCPVKCRLRLLGRILSVNS